MRLVFAGLELAREGDGITDFIDMSPPSVRRDSQTRKFKNCNNAEMLDRGNCVYEVKVKVPYFFNSYEEARNKALDLLSRLEELRQGQLSIIDGETIYRMPQAVISVKSPDERIGVFLEYEFTFQGGEFYRMTKKNVIAFGGYTICIGNILPITKYE